MKNITDILYQKDILSMFPKIQHYYSHQLGISVTPKMQSFSSQDEEDQDQVAPRETFCTFPYQIMNANKLPHHQRLAKIQTGDTLDSGELADILDAHFTSLIAHQNLALEKLVEIRKHIESLKSQHLTYDFMDDHPESAVIVRYLDGVYYSVVLQIKEKLLTELSQPNLQNTVQNHALLHPVLPMITELHAIFSHLSTLDLLDFQQCVDTMRTSEHASDDVQSSLQQISGKINTKIDKKVRSLAQELERSILSETKPLSIDGNAEDQLLMEMFPTLKSQMQLKKMLQINCPHTYPEFEHLLEQRIKISIRDLLDDIKIETNTSTLDLRKTQKLHIIKQLQDLCDEKTPSTELYQALIVQGDVLKAHSVGRYILECICWLLQIALKERHSVTLFQAIAPVTTSPTLSKMEDQKDLKRSKGP